MIDLYKQRNEEKHDLLFSGQCNIKEKTGTIIFLRIKLGMKKSVFSFYFSQFYAEER